MSLDQIIANVRTLEQAQSDIAKSRGAARERQVDALNRIVCNQNVQAAHTGMNRARA
jgi:hypothetical protein